MEKLPERPLSARSLSLTAGITQSTQTQLPSSKSSSRRSSGAYVHGPLPSPPPDPRQSQNVFQFPASDKDDLPTGYHTLFNYVESEEEFYKTLYKIIASDCELAHEINNQQSEQQQQQPHHERFEFGWEERRCAYCQHIQQECAQFIDPLQSRLGSTLSALLAAHGAVEQLSRLYAMWDKYMDVAAKWRQQRECLNYVNLLSEKMQQQQHEHEEDQYSDSEVEMKQSIALIESILSEPAMATASTSVMPTLSFGSFSGLGGGVSNPSSIKRGALKQQRERSKSMMVADVASALNAGGDHEHESKNPSAVPQLLRRQSTYSDGKSKVSKWTKVKAAFKWERANVPTLTEAVGASGVVAYGALQKDHPYNGVGLTPVNNEVARYLRVPSVPCGGGGSSADSILSSSSGHILSETGTPGTISSASSMDNVDSSCRSTLRRDSTKSDNRTVNDSESSLVDQSKNDVVETPPRFSQADKNMKYSISKKPASNKSLRQNNTLTDFDTLRADVIADPKGTTQRRSKPTPSPLNLNLRQDLTDSDFSYSPYSLKSPKDGTQSLDRSKKVNSPGNSSVPSSPSRHSDFFCEFESEDFSSGDFSEPTTPSHMTSHKSVCDKQQEVNQRYQMLRAKLDMEFEAKRREWDKIKTNTNACRAIALITPPKPEENQTQHTVLLNNLSTKLLEENLTPDFKRKLRKWRVKKQISVGGAHTPQTSPTSPVHEGATEVKTKIDWNLWKMGQLKLEGQGLTPLPDQRDLPEDFQKKLEEWNKLKQTGGSSTIQSCQESIKRACKQTEIIKKNVENKPHEKDKIEKLAKLKAIVTDHAAKEIEVKTTEGVMKFEGISRKFTRKLYEWEKARGIGPESSTFALLHPGYRPIVVDRITKENNTNDNSPTLSRSLSLDSIAHNNTTLPGISQQASSLSLNDANDLKEIDNHGSSDVIDEHEYKKYEEPEAVMVEVEDHIEETASPLVTAQALVEQQTPIYKYEEGSCSDYCNTRRIQSFESHTNLAPLLSALQRTEDIFKKLKRSSADVCQNAEVDQCETMLAYVRSIYPHYSDNLMKPSVLNAIADVQSEVSRISEVCDKYPLGEACCQEVIEECNIEYNTDLRRLYESLELLRHSIYGGSTLYPRDIVSDINITTAEVQSSSIDELKNSALEATDEWSASHAENEETETTTITQRTQFVTNNSANGVTGKKKLRLRKTGSRQNSKTESDSSDADAHSVLETPRRLKRKNFRLKQLSFDDDYLRSAEIPGDDVVYVLKVKPGQPIEQRENCIGLERCFSDTNNYRTRSDSEKCLIAPTVMPESPLLNRNELDENLNYQNENVFVKTKRKVFTTFTKPNGITVIERELSQPPIEVTALTDLPLLEKENTTTVEELAVPVTPTEFSSLIPGCSFSICKSLSQADVSVNQHTYVDERKCQSAEKLCSMTFNQFKNMRPPLASDSFRIINKRCTSFVRDATTPVKHDMVSPNCVGCTLNQNRKVHRFKKNSEKSHYHIPFLKFQSPTVKKIETKIAKTNSGASIGETLPQLISVDTIDNILPRITRKLERKPFAPTSMQPHAPKTNSLLLASAHDTPRTPLSERALRLQKAKQDFLQGSSSQTKAEVKRRDDIVRNETWEQYRRSDYSMSSALDEELELPKSFSSGTITADSYIETATHSDTGTNLDSTVYGSLPRSVSRSSKITCKLGFASLASKFRRGKSSKKHKDASRDREKANSNKVLSTLCRQTLMAEGIAGPELPADNSYENAQKSLFSPQAGRGFGGTSVVHAVLDQRQLERLSKSQSEQYVKLHKESIV